MSPLLSPFDVPLIDCLQHDLDSQGIRRLNCDMLHEDAASVLRQQQAWEQLRVPAWLLTAEWGTGAGSTPDCSCPVGNGYPGRFHRSRHLRHSRLA